MGTKYFTISIDDGLEQDKKIISILKEFGLKATFNLNSGLFGERTEIGRIGNMGFWEIPTQRFRTNSFHLLKYAPHHRIPKDELLQVYDGFEIASHTASHSKMPFLGKQGTEKEICGDLDALEALFGRKIRGMVFPYGLQNRYCEEILKKRGVLYARSVKKAKDFHFPENPYQTPMNCWHFQKNAFDLIDRFAALETEEDALFLLFAHGYELDFGTETSNWDHFRRLCECVAQNDDFVFCGVEEAFKQHLKAVSC